MQLRPPKLNALRLATKKGRFSSYDTSYAERFSCAGSTSTWPKSGLIVASSVRLDVRLYLMSAPALTLAVVLLWYGSRGSAYLNCPRDTTYGSSSACRGTLAIAIPSRWPKYAGPELSLRRRNDHSSCSLRRSTYRHSCIPHVCTCPPERRSCEYGIRISAVHPSAVTWVAPSHTGSHDGSPLNWSPRTPAGLISNHTSSRWLWYGSRAMANLSVVSELKEP